MYTVVLDWFGLSAAWFILFLGRLAQTIRTNRGFAGAGSLRLWLGFCCVLIASCTLAASLSSAATTNLFGHILSRHFIQTLGYGGTVLTMSALLIIGLLWFTGIGKRRSRVRPAVLATAHSRPRHPSANWQYRTRQHHDVRRPAAARPAPVTPTGWRPARAASPIVAVPTRPVLQPSVPQKRVVTQQERWVATRQPLSHANAALPTVRITAPSPPSLNATLRSIEASAAQWTLFTNAPACPTPVTSAAIPRHAPPSTALISTPVDVEALVAPTANVDAMPIAAAPQPVTSQTPTLLPTEVTTAPGINIPATYAPVASLAPPISTPPHAARYFPSLRAQLPTLDLLECAADPAEAITAEHLAQTSQLIEQRLQEFKVPVAVIGASAGPVITRFDIEPALGVRGSQIVGLMKDLSRGLGLTSIRVVETIPGKTCMGLELPNAKRHIIRLSEILSSRVYQHSASQLTLALGKDITGNPIVTDLAKAPHMLVAGTTGAGKSVAINAMIVSLLYKATPEDVRLLMIDPKMLELSVYENIPHLLAPVVTDMKLAAHALNWCVGEMERRYRLMSATGVRNLAGFNQKVRDAYAAGKRIDHPFSLTPDAPEPLEPLPFIVVVIDELADLMMITGKKIEELIARLAQKARASGIHLILATQRPSVDVITGLIKANIPTRIAFQVSSKIDSRTILDQMGAESLLGQGDMLFLPPGSGYPQRVHGAFVADEEVHRIVKYLCQFGEPQYEEGILEGTASDGTTRDWFGETPDAETDPLYDEAVAFVIRMQRVSISSVQRQLRVGYNRAARLVEQMEAANLVSPMGSNGSREVLVPAGE